MTGWRLSATARCNKAIGPGLYTTCECLIRGTQAAYSPRQTDHLSRPGEEMEREAEQSIRPMHLLLGLMNAGEGIGAGLLRTLGFSILPVHTASVPADAFQICTFCGRSGEEAAPEGKEHITAGHLHL
jgi:hypothetical protein